jgi:hypothetical protein
MRIKLAPDRSIAVVQAGRAMVTGLLAAYCERVACKAEMYSSAPSRLSASKKAS